jgi:hypothetical protein
MDSYFFWSPSGGILPPGRGGVGLMAEGVREGDDMKELFTHVPGAMSFLPADYLCHTPHPTTKRLSDGNSLHIVIRLAKKKFIEKGQVKVVSTIPASEKSSREARRHHLPAV